MITRLCRYKSVTRCGANTLPSPPSRPPDHRYAPSPTPLPCSPPPLSLLLGFTIINYSGRLSSDPVTSSDLRLWPDLTSTMPCHVTLCGRRRALTSHFPLPHLSSSPPRPLHHHPSNYPSDDLLLILLILLLHLRPLQDNTLHTLEASVSLPSYPHPRPHNCCFSPDAPQVTVSSRRVVCLITRLSAYM